MEGWIPTLLTLAVLAPLGSFFAILATGHALPRGGRPAFWISAGSIVASLTLSAGAATIWWSTGDSAVAATLHSQEPAVEPLDDAPPLGRVPAADAVAESIAYPPQRILAGPLLYFGQFGRLRLELTYAVDGLTIVFFVLVAGVATCVTIYAGSYLDEETREFEDVHATGADDGPVRRPGRYARFFQFLSLFCFSMLGLVLVGDLLGVFVFWELVGAASYFLIGFYVERDAASFAANKAFIVNRVGDFGMLVGIAMLFGAFGTLTIADRSPSSSVSTSDAAIGHGQPLDRLGLTTLVARRLEDSTSQSQRLSPPARPEAVESSGGSIENGAIRESEESSHDRIAPFARWRTFLTIAGLALFCGCVGKSAQVPLHVWLPDAMEGPTPVSALVHSATMVAAGVYLLGRIYPLLLPETLAVVAVVGGVTALAGAAMATVASDLKKALAFSTMSQLGLMTLAMGVGGWFAGLFHLATHACFKCLLFLGAGSVHHGAGTYDLHRLGGLGRKMPFTAGTMLIASIALSGLGLPLIVAPGLGLSGFHSKDSILEQAFVFAQTHPWGWTLFAAAALVSALTAYYIARIWLLIFWPRVERDPSPDDDRNGLAHAHEPGVGMLAPMGLLAFLAIVAGWTGWQSVVGSLLLAGVAGAIYAKISADRPRLRAAVGIAGAAALVWTVGGVAAALVFPDVSLQATLLSAMPINLREAHAHGEEAIVARAAAGIVALTAALIGAALAWRRFGAANRIVREDLPFGSTVSVALMRRLYVDDAYRSAIVEPYFALTRTAAAVDEWIFDGAANWAGRLGLLFARLWTRWVDEWLVDGGFLRFGQETFRLSSRLRNLQSGRLRQYVLYFAGAALGLFVLVFFFLDADVALEALRKATQSPLPEP